VAVPAGQGLALAIVLVGVLANAFSSVLGRSINRAAQISPLVVTGLSMSLGSVLLLSAGVLFQGLPVLGWREWALVGWLAGVNTAFAFTLWNRTLRSLTAMESSIINGTMLIQIAILAWIFLGETLGWKTGLGILITAAGTWLVQWRGPRR
jgi:drug/metabolite transporter (DMT)-like permease